MSEGDVHRWIVIGLFVAAVLVFVSLFRIVAPYGRHGRGGWGPEIPGRIGWILMESPAVLAFAAIFAMGRHRGETVPLILLGAWQFHYLHRTFVFPFRMRARGKTMPLAVAAMAIVFNLPNAYVNARFVSHLGNYEITWLRDPRFLVGLGVFALGWVINFDSDSRLFRLRRPGETGYRIPRGGLHELVACPNYLGEIVEWFGWALMTWSLAGLAFAVFTVANLAPRAAAHLAWYRQTFPDYPARRRALVPFVV